MTMDNYFDEGIPSSYDDKTEISSREISHSFSPMPHSESCMVVGPRPKELHSSPSPLLLQPVQVNESEIQCQSEDTITQDQFPSLTPSFNNSEASEPNSVESRGMIPELVPLPELRVNSQIEAIDSEDVDLDHSSFSQLDPIPEEMVDEEDDGHERMDSGNTEETLDIIPGPSTTECSAKVSTWATTSMAPSSAMESSTSPIAGSSNLPSQPQQETQRDTEIHLQPGDAEDTSSMDDTGYESSTVSTNGENSSVFDEDYHSDTSSYTASLLSDVKDYCYENGRRYHSYREGHYVLPNDETEQDRQDLLHHVRNLTLNGALFRAPIPKSPQRVLDIGTGTGIWAIDFADSYPTAEVIGTDLSPIQPSWVPPNLRFIVDDAESPWLFSTSRPFDFIHARDLGGAIADWNRLLHQGYRYLRPGGWIELQEFEVTLKSDDDSLRLAPTLCEFLGQLHKASEAFHRPMNIAEGHRQRLIEAGFEDVRDEVYKVPSSAWHDDPIQKQIGRYNLCSLLMAVEAYSLALFTRVLGWSNHQTQVFLAGLSVIRGKNHLDILSLHEKYGPIIRIGPNELAFNTARAIRDIYGQGQSQGQNGCFSKDPSHYLPPANGINHILSAIDNNTHARQRRLLATAFTDRALKAQEGLIQGYVDTMICKLRAELIDHDHQESPPTINILNWMNYTTFDITGDLMFGESFDCLKDNRLHPWIDLLFNSIKMLAVVGATMQFPFLHTLLEAFIPTNVTRQAEEHFNLAARKVDRRLEASISRPDFISAILQNGIGDVDGGGDGDGDGQRIMSRAEIHSNAFILIIAGSETSATCLSGCIYYLCKNPRTKNKLIHEIRSSFKSESEMTFRNNASLKYLSAVIEEALRVYPPFVTSLSRIVPKGGAFIDGSYVPGGTKVAMHHYASYHSHSNFALPNEFIPERWLNDARFESDRKDVLQPFSYGPRGCLGKNLAYAEIRLILCRLLWNFDVELCSVSENWVDQEVYFLWEKSPLMVNLKDRFMEES
ncbi:hypothetical protein PENSTE_c009G01792 [Penicillium steckii]|uniref:Uncharacterized protein n=1 Tax=Penicillium steckii TaxID=303698 RepID=A0A1V6TA08_9EURO|nr:hypothetical protein PENSTE_c009G01792 [Penicillium steckii]